MWEPLITLEQINEGSLIRQVILDGNHQHDTNYKVSRIGEFYFFIRATTQNGRHFTEEQQIIIGYRVNHIDYYGFEVWTE